jgi:hypothetical protein
MQIRIEAWARIGGVVEADNPEEALQILERDLRRKWKVDGTGLSWTEVACPCSMIRCYDCATNKNLIPSDESEKG